MIMKVSGRLFLRSYAALLIISYFLLVVYGNYHSEDDESKNKPGEASSYRDVLTTSREYSQHSCLVGQCSDMKECCDQVNTLPREIEKHRRMMTFSCNPVFKRFLAKLLKEIEKLGLPSAVTAEMHYDAELKLSKQMVAEIQKLVNDESSQGNQAVDDDALSQILINIKLHDHEAWKWRFEDTFGVELDTVFKVTVIVLIIVAIICLEMWSRVSLFVHFLRMFAMCFFISLVWNWFYLYKMALAEHQANIVKMQALTDKCTGLKKTDWVDHVKEWYRITWTFQDDPCKKYYEVLIVNPILVVPPVKAFIMTISSLITDPLKHLGRGISEFLIALLKDLPITLQIPVLILIMLSILVFIYVIGQAVVQHVVLRPQLGGHWDPPPAIALQPAAPLLQEPEEQGEEEREMLAGGGSASNTEMKHTQPASKKQSAKSDTEHNKTAGSTERNEVGNSASIGGDASKNEDSVENIGTLHQEPMQ